jgi:hypothetical protein
VAVATPQLLTTIDVADPSDISISDSESLGSGNEARGTPLVLRGLAYVPVGSAFPDVSHPIRLFDVSNPSAISDLGNYAAAPGDYTGSQIGLVSDGDYMYGFASDVLRVHEADDFNTGSPMVATYNPPNIPAPSNFNTLLLHGDYLYQAWMTGSAGSLVVNVRAIDVSNPLSPSEAGGDSVAAPFTSGFPQLTGWSNVEDDTAFIICSSSAAGGHLLAVDLSTPGSPAVAGSVQHATRLQDIQSSGGLAVKNGWLYVGQSGNNPNNRIFIWNVKDPAAMAYDQEVNISSYHVFGTLVDYPILYTWGDGQVRTYLISDGT